MTNFTLFIFDNRPKLSQYNSSLEGKIIPLNKFAFGFVSGELNDQTFYDEDYWTYDLYQIKFNGTE